SAISKAVSDFRVIKNSFLAIKIVESGAKKLMLNGAFLYKSEFLIFPMAMIFLFNPSSFTTWIKLVREFRASISSCTLFPPPPNIFRSLKTSRPEAEDCSSKIWILAFNSYSGTEYRIYNIARANDIKEKITNHFQFFRYGFIISLKFILFSDEGFELVMPEIGN